MNIDKFLQTKPLFYKKIDYTRMPRAWDSIKSNLKPFKIIHIIGTNGKGSTGRFLAQILHRNGKSVGHYTSPHILEFRERFWINGDIVCKDDLQKAHEFLQEILSDEFKIATSYFEYATLLSAVLFCECDYFICEAGMGGEYDATNVFDKALTIFTPIGLDHMPALGNNIIEISTTKFKAMTKNAILNDDMDKICVDLAKDMANNLHTNIKFANEILSDTDKDSINLYAKKHNLPKFLVSNLTLASAGAKAILGTLDISNLDSLNLRGRCEKIAKNLYIDVGHNELGAKAMAKHFSGKKLTLIYNSFLDKDFKAVLFALKPILKSVLIFNYDSGDRELGADMIKTALKELDINFCEFQDCHLREIQDQKSDEIYLVFGSFYLVEAFLRKYQI